MEPILVAFDEQDVHFETGVPVRFRYVHNTSKAGHFGHRFLQDIEPHGRYMLHNEDPGKLPKGWESGWASFVNPLVIQFNMVEGSSAYDEFNWKAVLANHFGVVGKRLTNKLIKMGFDGIVTAEFMEYHGWEGWASKEIVSLKTGRKK